MATVEVEGGEMERSHEHDAFEPVELVVGQLDMAAITVDRDLDTVTAPPFRTPHEIRKVGKAWAATRGLPVDDDRTVIAQHRVVGIVQQVAVN